MRVRDAAGVFNRGGIGVSSASVPGAVMRSVRGMRAARVVVGNGTIQGYKTNKSRDGAHDDLYIGTLLAAFEKLRTQIEEEQREHGAGGKGDGEMLDAGRAARETHHKAAEHDGRAGEK